MEAKTVSNIKIIEEKRVDRAAPAHMYQNFINSPTNFHLTKLPQAYITNLIKSRVSYEKLGA